MAAFGVDTVTWNDEAAAGVKALFAAPLMGVFISVLFTAIFGSITALGLWFYSFFKPLTIIYFNSEDR